MSTKTSYLTYTGPSRGVHLLSGMLEAEGYEVVTQGRLTESRSNVDTIVIVTLMVTGPPGPAVWKGLKSAVARFKDRAPGARVEMDVPEDDQ
jgi:hypothetical protein